METLLIIAVTLALFAASLLGFVRLESRKQETLRRLVLQRQTMPGRAPERRVAAVGPQRRTGRGVMVLGAAGR